MATTKQYDIVIVGGGLVGASLALALAESDFQLAIVDRQTFDEQSIPFRQQQATEAAEAHFDSRVSAITPRSQKFLESIKVWSGITERRLCSYQEMEVWDGEGTGSIHFSASDLHQPALGHIVENSVLLAALYQSLKEQHNIDLLLPWQLQSIQDTESGVRLFGNAEESIDCSLLIAADGANSKVRELGCFETEEWDYGHHAIVTTVRTQHAHRSTAWQRFMASGPLAFLPLQQGAGDAQKYCSIVWSILPDDANELMGLADADFARALGKAFENRLGEIEWVDKRIQFPLRQRHAQTYYKGGIVLVGDAAHTIHPLAGQGVNLGLSDACALAKEIKHGIAAGRRLNDARILERYQRSRAGHNKSMMWLMEGFKHLFADQSPPVTWLRNLGLSTAGNLSLVRNQLAKQAMGMD